MKIKDRQGLIKKLDKIFIIGNPVQLLSNLVYGMIFCVLFVLLFIGIREKLLEGYFEYMVFGVLLVFCVLNADMRITSLEGLFIIPGLLIFLHYILLMVGHETVLLEVSINIIVLLGILSIVYLIGFRKLLISKLPPQEKGKFKK